MKASRANQRSPDFAVQAESVIQHLRRALADVINGMPGFTYRRPNDLAGALNLDPKLAWKVGRCIEGGDPFACAQFVPGPTGMRAFLRAAQRHAAPAGALEHARHAFDAFRELVHTHAGTRKSFNMLAAGLATSERVRADVEHRRLTFEGGTYVWGVQARTIFRVNLVHPSANPDAWDGATLRGFIDFRRMRPNVAWRIARPVSVDCAHGVHAAPVRSVLDPRAADGVPLLTDFCTQPYPQFRPVVGAHGEREFEFVADSVGNTARITCVTGEALRAVEPRYRTELYPEFCAAFPVRMPAEVLIFDLLLHRALFANGGPLRAELYGDLFGGGPGVRYEPSDRLPLHDPLVHLGTGPDAALTPDIPRYPDMLHYALERLGWNGQEFDLYRLRMQYPPIPTTLMLCKPLPNHPTTGALHQL